MPSANIWANNTPQGEDAPAENIVLPSGQECTARKLGMETLLVSGSLGEVDQLTAMVAQYTRKVKGAKGRPDGQEIDEAGMMGNPEALKTMITLADKLLPQIVVSPSVVLHYTTTEFKGQKYTKKIPGADRVPGQVYTDQIGLEDKFHLFRWAMTSDTGGVLALESFRDDSAGDVGDVADVTGVPRPAKRPSGRKRRR